MCNLKFGHKERPLSLSASESQREKTKTKKSPISKKKVSFLLDIIIIDHILALFQKNETVMKTVKKYGAS